MRRSAAPSQQGPAPKKQCFFPPTVSHFKLPDVTSKTVACSGASMPDVDLTRSARDIVHLIQNGSAGSHVDKAKSSSFHVPDVVNSVPSMKLSALDKEEAQNAVKSTNCFVNGQSTQHFNGTQRFKSRPQLFEAIQQNATPTHNSQMPGAQCAPESSSSDLSCDIPAKYFSVMWCKVSKKKHKKWEGDAILITQQRSVTLVDMEGKEIGRSSGYKTAELNSLTDGQMLVIGGKEIEVMGVLSEEQFKSGKCFQSSTSSLTTSTVSETSVPSASRPTPVPVSRPFVRPPFKTGDIATSMQFKTKISNPVQSYFNPAAPNALVMPRPTDTHQCLYNKHGNQVIDVVVDPHIAVHLRPHQRQGVIFLYECALGMRPHQGFGAILADEMGLGKTLQCIALIWTLYKQGPYAGRPIIKRVLILTPGSLVKNWRKEFRKWLSNERLTVFAVGGDCSIDDFVNSNRYPVLIISYEMFIRNIETLRKVKFDLLVCDEGHRLKNANIKTAMFASSLAISRRIVLTGTPIQNELQELYALADFCNPGILGTLAAFRRVYEEPIVNSRQSTASPEEQELGQTRASELSRITDSFILRRTQEINNKYLPPRADVVLFCSLSDLQLRLYRALVKSRAVLACLRDADSACHLRCISALRKLCNHPHLLHAKAVEGASIYEEDLYRTLVSVYPPDYGVHSQTEYSGKMKVLESLLLRFSILSPKEKVVVVSNYTSMLDLIEILCKNHDFPFLRLDGQTPTGRRMELVERFNSPSTPEFVFLLSTKAGGIGLNLIGASRLVLYDVDWNPANDLQAMARVWRDGQRRHCYVYRLLSAGSIEEKIYQRQVAKQGLSGAIVDAEFKRSPTFDADELRELFVLDEETLCSTHQLIGCNCLTSSLLSFIPEHLLDKVPDSAYDSRDCKLQRRKSVGDLQKNTGMDELLEWTHIAGPAPDLSALDPSLTPCSLKNVSFAMWTKNNSLECRVAVREDCKTLKLPLTEHN